MFDSLDETAARENVSRTALSIDNARRHLAERRAAEALPRSLLPSSLGRISAADTAIPRSDARAVDADAGAWVDTIPLSSARVAFAAGQTSGRGVRAAAAAGRLRTAIQTLSDLDIAPDEPLTHVDDLVRRLPNAAEAGEADPQALEGLGEVGATCLYVIYDPVAGRCSVASAGHRAPALISPYGGFVPVPLEPGPPPRRESAPLETVGFVVEPGSTLIPCRRIERPLRTAQVRRADHRRSRDDRCSAQGARRPARDGRGIGRCGTGRPAASAA
ncbi:SpoIIE family protein phosphatase [Streptomyces sp. NPDC006553]|uniref:SpoIIE family protein phosphatase n=1 Tax=Streptomyces sp. NPDC006553 TaxID=3157180 RepID=UPI0033B6CB49